MTQSMTHFGHAKKLLALGLPLIGSHLAQMAIAVTDNLMLGWYDVTVLAAAVIATTFFFVLFIVGSGFGFAVLPMVARAMAEDYSSNVRRVTRMALWLSAIYGACVMPLMIWSEPVLRAMGQDADVAVLAQDYLYIAAFSMIPALFVMVLKTYLAALERTQIILVITILAALLNAALNYALIFGNFGAPELGIKGAAVASLSLQILTVVALVFYIRRVTPEHALFQNITRPDWPAFGRVFNLGWPIGLTNLAESGLFSVSAIMMGWIAIDTLAAHGIAIQIASITFMAHLGLSQAATVRVGNALGRKDRAGLVTGGQSALILSVIFACATMALFLLLPEPLIRAFLDPTDPRLPAIVAIGAVLLALAAVFQLVDGAQVMALGLLRGFEDTKIPMIIAGLSYWAVGIPASYFLAFPLGFGATGIWSGLCIGFLCAAVFMLLRYQKLLSAHPIDDPHPPA